jgi:FAD/FMN-containing dehydrogenase
MKKSILKTLESNIQGDVLYKKEFREFYSVDASSYQIIPKIIVIAKNEKDVIQTIKIAKKFKTSVTVRGAGTGLVGSALNKGIIIDMKNFDSIKLNKKSVVVGSGVLKGKLDKELEKVEKFFPPNPSIGNFCSIGGMLGNNSSGSRSLKYGSMIDNVSEIILIDGNGNKIKLPKNKNVGKKIFEIIKIDNERIPKTSKNSSGYRIDKIRSNRDAHKIIIGAEGTLGIILSAKLNIIDNPKRRILFVIEYKSIFEAAKNSLEINKTKPSTLEFVDKNTLKQIKFNFSKNTKCLLFVEYDEKTEQREKEVKTIISGKIIQKLYKNQDMKKWWRFRDSSLHYSLKSIQKEKRVPHVIEDASVPLENLPKLFSLVKKIEKEYKIKSIMYGHIGNGNIHVRLISERTNNKMIKNIAIQYFNEIIKNKGTISAEHGDGLARSEFVKQQYGKKNIQIFKKIKKFMDPNNILNPGKIITTKSSVIKNLKKI